MATKETILKLSIVLFFGLVVAMSGCVSQPKQQQQQQQLSKTFVGGTKGLELSFLEGQPPAQVIAGTEFPITIRLVNDGEGALQKITGDVYGFVEIQGIDTQSFQTDRYKTITEDITPKKKVGNSTVPGGMAELTWTPTAPKITGASQDYPLLAKLIYGYKTTAVGVACLKQNLIAQATGGKELCKISGTIQVASSSGPIQVTSIEESPSGFQIKIKNSGTGYPFYNSVEFKDYKESEINTTTRNYVYLSSVKLGDEDITNNCTSRKIYIPPSAGETTFFCSYKTTGAAAEVVKQLTIELTYGYVNSIQTKFTVLSYEE